MKPKPAKNQWLSSGLAGLALAATIGSNTAQAWENPQPFDTTAGIASWVTWWGPPTPTFTFDSTLDAGGNAASGSLRLTEDFVGVAGEQFMTFGTFANGGGWDGSVVLNAVGNYKNLVLDLRIDPSTAPTVNNNYGPLEFGLVTHPDASTWGQVYLTNYTVPLSATNWTHLAVPIDPAATGLGTVAGWFIKMWSNGAFTNTLALNVDNLWLEPVPTNAPPTPPPTMGLEEAKSGLNFIAAGTGQYDRQNIRTLSPEYSWLGKGNSPVSYSFTVSSYPGSNHPNFEIHTYLIPVPYDPAIGNGTIGTGSSPDWDQTNCIFMELQNKADGSATFTFRWKTNSIPDGNATYYSSPLAILTETNGPLGTWALSFLHNTNVTLTSPSGGITNFEFSADKLAGYVDQSGTALPLYYYIGAKPQDPGNVGLSAQVSRVKVQGAGTLIDEDFLNQPSLNTNVWEFAQNNAGAVLVVPANSIWVNWTLPDAGFVLQTNSVATGNGWKENGLATLQMAAARKMLISPSGRPGIGQGFFRLLKRQYTKLQVLMPGETAAPDTASGKTGTPDAQTSGIPFNVTVNAVDNAWHRIALAPNDTVIITSSDATAMLPANGALVGGTQTFNVTFGTTGTFTVTATDDTDSKKKADTGSSTTVN